MQFGFQKVNSRTINFSGRLLGASKTILLSLLLGISCNKSLVECDDMQDPAEEKPKSVFRPGSPCVEKSDDEKALLYLNRGDAGSAIYFLEPLVAADPTGYFRYPRLSAAYAMAGSFNLLEAATKGGVAAGSSTSALTALIRNPSEVGAEAFASDLAYLHKALGILQSMAQASPEQFTDPKISYRSSAGFQLRIYALVVMTMELRKIQFEFEQAQAAAGAVIASSGGKFSAEALKSMSAESVTAILAVLQVAVDTPVGDAKDQAMKDQISGMLTGISSQPGETDQERLASYMTK